MSRYNEYKPLDDPPQLAGDVAFVGVNMRLEPAQLPPGYVSEAINMRFRNGVAETRKGFVKPVWANKIVSGQTQPWGTVYGVGVFSDPFTLQEYLIIAADGFIYCAKANNAPFQLPLTAGSTVTSPVLFTQAFDIMLAHQGPAIPTLQMPRIQSGFDVVTQTHSGTGTDTIPNSTRSIFFQNRIFIPRADDTVSVSDYGDYTRYLPVAQEFKINVGSADNLVTAAKFNDTTLIVFKDHSIYAVNNVYGNMAAAQQDELTDQYGLVAAKSVAQVGNDLWFLTELGVMSLNQTEQNKLQSTTLPVSDPIQPLIDRINWRFAAGAVAAYWDSKYYLAVPLDDAEVLGDELVPQITFQNPTNILLTPLVAGATYRWTLGVGTSLTNGSQTLTFSADFVAQGTSATVVGCPGNVLVSDSVKRVFKGVNNAVLVYDFLNQAWCGYDQAPGLMVMDFFRFTYRNQRRLFFIGNDGFIKMYEEDFEDEVSVPYADVTVTATPVGGDTISVNGGTVIASLNSSVNAGDPVNAWGCGGSFLNATIAATNLFVDSANHAGYFAGGTLPWTAPIAPNTITVPISGGVRFYGTNGVLPTVTLGGTGATWITVNYVNTLPVQSSITTRGYTSQAMDARGYPLPHMDLAHFNWLNIDLQTWNPTYTLSLLGGGVEQTNVFVTDQTKDRTLYYQPADAAPYLVTNDNNDFAVPYRQDYSLLLGSIGTGVVLFDLQSASGGVRLDYHQEIRHSERINLNGRAARVQLTNKTGRIRLLTARLESDAQPTYPGTAT